MQSLENCPRCGELFVKSLRPVCNKCHKEVEDMFQKVYTFIRKRENRQAKMNEVVEGTGVPEEDITRFIKEGRLHLSRFPNLAYACESCGSPIREGRLCASCKKSIDSGLQAQEQEREREKKAEEERKRHQTYYSMDNRMN
ncbi:TIGR03826 family flagellar region protein [Salibacterium halotolerans]|uniref:Flagellar operon protein TIGR03826 n=1 Tax=Salibacterium halotolerans TaxID=1884432 RepID=A0A1I5WY88_9BACI|nr:TIGR03826 family flagellar region protein [Salibacterium halotolerans]SFQ24644.1 flagellar operon protein TIGR03826 [Salibacterium halotolerans]